MRLYARIGDAGDYNDFDGEREFADTLREYGIDPATLERQGEYGLQCPGYTGQNYISAYYGTDVETPVRSLTDEELDTLKGTKMNEDYISYLWEDRDHEEEFICCFDGNGVVSYRITDEDRDDYPQLVARDFVYISIEKGILREITELDFERILARTPNS